MTRKQFPTLANESPPNALRRLATAVSDLLPSPIPSEPVEAEIVREALTLLRMPAREATSLSEEERAKVLELLTDSMMRYGNQQFDLRSARERLGTSGELPVRAYDVTFAEPPVEIVTRSQLTDAIYNAEQVQHYMPASDRRFEGPFDAISMFVRRVQATRVPCFLLVIAMRTKATLKVVEGWRVYPEFVDVREVERPLDMLRAFATTYGMPVTVGEHAPAMFVEHEVVPLRQVPGANVVVRVVDAANKNSKLFAIQRVSPLGLVEVFLAYCVDMSRYRADLQRVK